MAGVADVSVPINTRKEVKISTRRFRACEIANVDGVESVDLESNSLSELPSEITAMGSTLVALRVRWNHLETLPEAISQLSNLELLDVSSNKIAWLPEATVQLASLTTANFSDNCLTELPSGIGTLTNLLHLQIQYNQIATLPESLSCLTNLQSLSKVGNPVQFHSEDSERIKAEGPLPCPAAVVQVHSLQQSREQSRFSEGHIVLNRLTSHRQQGHSNSTPLSANAPALESLQARSRRQRQRVGLSLSSLARETRAHTSTESDLQANLNAFQFEPTRIAEPTQAGTNAAETSLSPFKLLFRRFRRQGVASNAPSADPGHAQDDTQQQSRIGRRGLVGMSWSGSGGLSRPRFGMPVAHGAAVGGDAPSVHATLSSSGPATKNRGSTACSGCAEDALLCPISQAVMQDPVVAADGHSYDRAAISAWLRRSGRSPMTGLELPSRALLPNYTLRSIIANRGAKLRIVAEGE